MGIINWETTKEEDYLINKIIDRYIETAKKLDIVVDRLVACMSLTACHKNGMPLKLKELLEDSSDFDLLHDISGIIENIDRNTGRVHRFAPRYQA